MAPSLLLGLDQGTSGTKAIIVDQAGTVRGYAYRPLARTYPRPGWVEQDPAAVAAGVAEAITGAIADAGCRPAEIAACGLACQRNTDFAWDRRTGLPIGQAITWQDLRTVTLLEELQLWPLAGELRHRLGYAPGTYMSALHLAWRARHDPAFQDAAAAGNLMLGLSAAWLLQALGRPAGHYQDHSLVQATGLFDFRAHAYWVDWLARLGLPAEALPAAVPTLHEYGHLRVTGPDGAGADVPVLAMIGDQQAALFGHNCRHPGEAECTHGTASYVKVFLGEEAPYLENVNVYYAWRLDGRQYYCLEAPTTVTGAVVRWMRDEVNLVKDYQELEALGGSVPEAGGLYFVPALTGLDAPYGDPRARGTLFGLTLGHSRAHIVRAFLDALGYQLRAILESVAADTGLPVRELLVGGGVSASDLACQIQADQMGIPVKRPRFAETTVWAAAMLAGLGAGVWAGPDALPSPPGSHDLFEPQMIPDQREAGYQRWKQAVALARRWGDLSHAVDKTMPAVALDL